MNFYQSVFLKKNFLENIRKKVGFGGNYPLIFNLSDQTMSPNIIFKNLDYICHKSVELQKKNLKHFKFWKYFYWKHDKATLNDNINRAATAHVHTVLQLGYDL